MTASTTDVPNGLSPHSRGKLKRGLIRTIHYRSIPAFTGETRADLVDADRDGVYPRIHGGNVCQFPASRLIPGLSPHSRGKH